MGALSLSRQRGWVQLSKENIRGTGIRCGGTGLTALNSEFTKKGFYVSGFTVYIERGFPGTDDLEEIADLGGKIVKSVLGV